MAGNTISIDFNPSRAIAGLSGLDAGLRDTTPLMEQLSEYLWRSTGYRFKSQTDPEGTPWQALSPRYLETKSRNKDRILTLRGYLRSSFVKKHDAKTARVGSNSVIAAIHQFGGRTRPHVIEPRYKKALAFGGAVRKSVQHPGSDMPARPFLGLSEADRNEIREIAIDFMQRRM